MAAPKINLKCLHPGEKDRLADTSSGKIKETFYISILEYLFNARPFGSPHLRFSIVLPLFRWFTIKFAAA